MTGDLRDMIADAAAEAARHARAPFEGARIRTDTDTSGDTDTGDGAAPPAVARNLPDDFWQARPVLAHVRQAAHHRGRSADAVLGAVLCRVAALVPPSVHLPAIVGSEATVDYLAPIVAGSGGGKSSAVAVAKSLVPIDDDTVVVDFPLGSGEGLIEAYLGAPEDVLIGGALVKVRPQVRRAVLAEVDEGQVLGDLAQRKGATLLPTLRSAWSGNLTGNGNAGADRNRRLAPRAARFAATIALQPKYAAAILADAAGGTPQRMVWFSAEDPAIPDDAPAWPGELTFTPPPPGAFGIARLFAVAPDVAAEIAAKGRKLSRGELAVDELDSHADLCRLKTAALLAVLDSRSTVTVDDWRLAGMVMAASTAVRTFIAETARMEARRTEAAATARAVRREVAIATTADERALERAVAAIGRRAHRDAGARLGRSKFGHAVASRDRQLVPLDDAIAEAERRGYIVADGDVWVAGLTRPA
jgi:hypothetical protein